ncbi:B-cell differentiation antigen CD72 [Talpa occidentalis]|uniref:B-cell differentiation antigen CD72 n=1 Tax=Talpa occidentalis TaxID=50954 RepID=UPI0023F9A950|nr:B-cell differentiation antigen CD72 [Talpa occidentalis]
MAEAITYADLRFVKAPLKNRLEQDPDADEDGELTYENVQVSPASAGRSGPAYSGLGEKAGRAAHVHYFLAGLLLTCLLLGVAATCLGVRYLQVSQQLQLVSGVLEATNSSLLLKTAQLGRKDRELQESKEDLGQSQQSRQQEQKDLQDTQEKLQKCQLEKEKAESDFQQEEERRRNLQDSLSRVQENLSRVQESLSRAQEATKLISCPSPGRCCPVGWIQIEKYCFHLSLTRRTWDESQKYCTSLSSKLATFRGSYPSEYGDIANKLFLQSSSPGSYWTGLKLGKDRRWTDSYVEDSRNYEIYEYERHEKYGKLVLNSWANLVGETRASPLLPCICQRATFRSPDGDGSLH